MAVLVLCWFKSSRAHQLLFYWQRKLTVNIYLDIDGVILGTKSPKRDIARLLKYILKHHPGSTYWLTTHCRGGENHCAEWLAQNSDLPEKLISQLGETVKPTDWGVLKTDAIDFTQPFVWLDDAPLQSEKQALAEHNALDSCLIMDKHNPKMARIALQRLKHAKH